ncbi:nucleoporin-domain-containing protein [Fistulina hepatica ATCC 64428]|uniref:Nucleoporin-domain-containing protein n=1 Tax=Fistulina hepatica ATCC 64428 TaxID=1128425 RepID=A0A0D7AGX6_9AGAR|nr:nucleoporin-domain-containing protein [Fistulina hepatica ATCC 64428]
MATSALSGVLNPGSLLSTSPAKTVDLDVLQRAAAVVQEQLTKDANIVPDFGDILTARGPASAEYNVVSEDDYTTPFLKDRLIPLPESLWQFYNAAQVETAMGLFPEIERAWLTVNNQLFLWDYNNIQELSSFAEQPDVITAVAIVKPKKGLFIDNISYLLVITTHVSVILIALSSSPAPNSPGHIISLYATDLSIKTDMEMRDVVGTADGRIFMTGVEDGYIYELHYQESDSWFSKRIQLINHSSGGLSSLLPKFGVPAPQDRISNIVADTKRNFIYTLTPKNVLSVYKPDGDKSITHLQTISNILQLAQEKAPGSPALIPGKFRIAALVVIDPAESRMAESRMDIHLMAVTSNGVRLYFSPRHNNYGYSGSGGGGLTLLHVRLPPTNLIRPDGLPNSPPVVINALEYVGVANGMVLASTEGDTGDYIICLSPDLTRIGNLDQNISARPVTVQYSQGAAPSRSALVETVSVLVIKNKIYALAPVKRETASNPAGEPAPSEINELATQFSQPAQKFMFLSPMGLSLVVRRRALDHLLSVLESIYGQTELQPVLAFRDSYGRDQTCAMLLGIACGNSFVDARSSVPAFLSEQTITALQFYYDLGEHPRWDERMTYGAESQGTAVFSGRRQGLAIYMSRLLRPFWKSKVIQTGSNLNSLKESLVQNPRLFQFPTDIPSSRSSSNDQQAWKVEQTSVMELTALISRTIEAMSFVLLLNDYHLGDLIAQCDAETKNMLSNITFEGLITSVTGIHISRALVNVIIDQQIGQQISVDTISQVLQHRCGSFCSTEDVMLYKAKENIRRAAETKNRIEKNNWLSESLRLFAKGAKTIEFEKLREIIGEYQALDFAKGEGNAWWYLTYLLIRFDVGAIELPLICAKAYDSDNAGLDFWLSGQTMVTSDYRGEMYVNRRRCYDLVLDSLEYFERKTVEAGQDTPSPEELSGVRDQAYSLAFSSDDEMFHSTLYDKLIERNMADDLLEMRPPFLEAHLKRDPPTVQKYDLLWQFYVKSGQSLRAAEVLAALAESPNFALDLHARLEFLTLAVGNAKSHPVSDFGRQETAIAFLTDLEDKLDVAQVQIEIYNILTPIIHEYNAPEPLAVFETLSVRLMSVSELYNRVAVPFGFPNIQLMCLNCASDRDDHLVEAIWSRIIAEVVERTEGGALTIGDQLSARIIPLGQKFYSSPYIFPLGESALCQCFKLPFFLHKIAHQLMVQFCLDHKGEIPSGWAPRLFVQCGVPYSPIWDVFHVMYDRQVHPFNDASNIRAVLSDIAVLLADWVDDAQRSTSTRSDLPAGRVDACIEQYLTDRVAPTPETRTKLETVRRQLRQLC